MSTIWFLLLCLALLELVHTKLLFRQYRQRMDHNFKVMEDAFNRCARALEELESKVHTRPTIIDNEYKPRPREDKMF